MSRPIIEPLKCIFVHVPKTGGVAIDHYLQMNCDLAGFTGHHAATSLRDDFPAQFAAYFKFAFVRNPWDRLVSAFFFLDQGGYSKIDQEVRKKYVAPYRGDFSAFVMDLRSRTDLVRVTPETSELGLDGCPYLTTHFIEQSHWLCDSQGEVLVDFTGRFENLRHDFKEVANRLNLPDVPLQQLNSSRHEHYSRYYSDATADVVQQLYSNDIATFRYSFENDSPR